MDNSIPVRILRKNVVRDLTGWSNSTIWRKVKDGIFPSPVRLGA